MKQFYDYVVKGDYFCRLYKFSKRCKVITVSSRWPQKLDKIWILFPRFEVHNFYLQFPCSFCFWYNEIHRHQNSCLQSSVSDECSKWKNVIVDFLNTFHGYFEIKFPATLIPTSNVLFGWIFCFIHKAKEIPTRWKLDYENFSGRL